MPYKFVDKPIKVSVNPILNSLLGAIRCRDLVGMVDVDNRDELKDQGVNAVKRIKIKNKFLHRLIVSAKRKKS